MFNHLFYENWKMSKSGYSLILNYLQDNNVFFKQEGFDLFIDFNKKNKIKKLNQVKEDVVSFNIKWIDTSDSKHCNDMLKHFKMGSEFLFQSGGWDATNYFLVGSKKDKVIKKEMDKINLAKAYSFVKHKDKSGKKEKLKEVEELLFKLGMKENEIKEWILSPHDFLFNASPMEKILINQEDLLIDFLKKRVGDH